MRGGSIPLLAWGTLLLVLAVGNWIWDAKPVNAAVATFAALVIYLGALLIRLVSGRRAVQKGPPEPEPELLPMPQASMSPVIAALGLASFVFGFTFSSFLIYFGAGLMLLATGRAVVELRAERATRDSVMRERQR